MTRDKLSRTLMSLRLYCASLDFGSISFHSVLYFSQVLTPLQHAKLGGGGGENTAQSGVSNNSFSAF